MLVAALWCFEQQVGRFRKTAVQRLPSASSLQGQVDGIMQATYLTHATEIAAFDGFSAWHLMPLFCLSLKRSYISAAARYRHLSPRRLAAQDG